MTDSTGVTGAPDAAEPRGGHRRRPRARYVVAAIVCAAVIGWILWAGLTQSIVYLEPVSDAVSERDARGDDTFRMAGIVVTDTIVETPSGVDFELSEGGVRVAVTHRGDPPDLFDEGAPVVVEGRWAGTRFDSDRLLIRHGNEYSEYEPPADGGT